MARLYELFLLLWVCRTLVVEIGTVKFLSGFEVRLCEIFVDFVFKIGCREDAEAN